MIRVDTTGVDSISANSLRAIRSSLIENGMWIAMHENDQLELRQSAKNILLRLRIRPGGKRDRVMAIHGGALKCSVTAAPEKGKANKAVLSLLAKTLAIPIRSLEIVGGATSPDKTVAISGLGVEELRQHIARALE
jgi:uncharacterized protein (TIGR00251 family)